MGCVVCCVFLESWFDKFNVCIELACCDGSDEAFGVCENKCKEIGEAYRAKQAAERKIRKTVCTVNKTYSNSV